jgi:hypothetical protein
MARRLVSPQLILYVLEDADALASLVKRLHLTSKLHANLRQLCQWEKVGTDRLRRFEADNWQLLEDGNWLQCDGSETIEPVFGKTAHAHNRLVRVHGVKFSQDSLRRLLPSKTTGKQERKVVDGWRVVWMPLAASQLTDGDSLVGRTRVAAASDLVHPP